MKWRIIIDEKPKSPAENMATDEAIMMGIKDGFSIPTIRFYDWSPPTASIGYHQTAAKEIDFSKLQKKGFGFVRRPTGGRLVLHKNEVTYAVIAPIEERLGGELQNSYKEISLALKEGLHCMGISDIEFEKGELTSMHQREHNNPCFGSSSRYELNYHKKKLIGSAQVRRNNVLLQHGSILLQQDQSEVAQILPDLTEKQKETLTKYLQRKTIAINQILKSHCDFFEASKFLEEGFKKAWKEDEFASSSKLSEKENILIGKFVIEKYGKDEWNFKK